MQFRLVIYRTREANKYLAHEIHEFLGSREAIQRLWHELHQVIGWPHVEVYDISGMRQQPQNGVDAMVRGLP